MVQTALVVGFFIVAGALVGGYYWTHRAHGGAGPAGGDPGNPFPDSPGTCTYPDGTTEGTTLSNCTKNGGMTFQPDDPNLNKVDAQTLQPTA